jgi:hypothetical protein
MVSNNFEHPNNFDALAKFLNVVKNFNTFTLSYFMSTQSLIPLANNVVRIFELELSPSQHNP